MWMSVIYGQVARSHRSSELVRDNQSSFSSTSKVDRWGVVKIKFENQWFFCCWVGEKCSGCGGRERKVQERRLHHDIDYRDTCGGRLCDTDPIHPILPHTSVPYVSRQEAVELSLIQLV